MLNVLPNQILITYNVSDEIKLSKEATYAKDAIPDIFTGVVGDIVRKVRF